MIYIKENWEQIVNNNILTLELNKKVNYIGKYSLLNKTKNTIFDAELFNQQFDDKIVIGKQKAGLIYENGITVFKLVNNTVELIEYFGKVDNETYEEIATRYRNIISQENEIEGKRLRINGDFDRKTKSTAKETTSSNVGNEETVHNGKPSKLVRKYKLDSQGNTLNEEQ